MIIGYSVINVSKFHLQSSSSCRSGGEGFFAFGRHLTHFDKRCMRSRSTRFINSQKLMEEFFMTGVHFFFKSYY